MIGVKGEPKQMEGLKKKESKKMNVKKIKEGVASVKTKEEKPHSSQHPRVPPQRRGRPPCRESHTPRSRRPVRLAITAVPKITPMPGNRKTPQNLSPYFFP
jgi:hypothetical protein